MIDKAKRFYAFVNRSMWLRLVAAFAFIILLGVLGVIFLISTITAREFNVYVSQDSARWARWLAPQLAAYYQQTGSWDGVNNYIVGSQGMSMMMGRDRGPMLMMERDWRGRGEADEMTRMMPPAMMEDMWTGMGLRVLVLDMQGRVVVDTSGEAVGQVLPPDTISHGVPISVGGQDVGSVIVSPLYTVSTPEVHFLQGVSKAVLLVGLGMGILALLMAAFISRQITAPLRQLALAANEIAKGNLNVRVPIRGDDELGQVGQAFNRMALALAEQQRLRQQLMADIAHELRTPLSVVQAQVEAILDDVFQPSPENLRPIHEQVDLLRRLIEDLRDLSLAEAGELDIRKEPLEFSVIVRRAVQSMRPVAQEKDVELRLNVRRPLLPVMGDGQRLEQVLLNLLSNAIRHTPRGGHVEIHVWSDEASVYCRVRDTGPGIAQKDLPHVFERFWRADKSRSRETGGTGLGLAIARRWVEAHGGRIWADNAPEGGAVFTLVLPAAH